MKRTIIFFYFLLIATAQLMAQEPKLRVAIFDPVVTGQNFDEGSAVIIREMVSSAIVNSGKYTIVERSLIDQILKEQKFSNSGVVDDSQVSAIGKLAGANKVILSVLSSAGDKGLLSLKIIDVESANVESQKTKLVKQSEILDIATSLALEVIGESVAETTQGSNGKSFLGGLFSKKSNPEAEKEPAKTYRGENQKPIANVPQEAGTIVLEFEGYDYGKNPTVDLFLEDVLIGSGDLNHGFSIQVVDHKPGKYKLKAEWSGLVDAKSYTINTVKKKHFRFEYARTGFGYAFVLKD
jgi:hypothetical protein